MSKENANVEMTSAAPVLMNELQEAIQSAIDAGTITEAPTLKAMAEVLGINPQRIYTVAKQPKEGEIYDARVYNWDAIQKFISKRLDEGQTYADFIALVIAKDEELKASDRRSGRRVSDADRYVKCSTGLMPKRKYEVEVGQKILLKKVDEIFEVILASDTHVVLAPEGTTEYKVLANWTFNSQVIPPHRFDETLKARADKKAAAEAEAADTTEAAE